MIVGYQTVVDAGATNHVGRGKGYQAGLQMPIVEAATAALGGLPVSGELVNPSIDLCRGSLTTSGKRFDLEPGLVLDGFLNGSLDRGDTATPICVCIYGLLP